MGPVKLTLYHVHMHVNNECVQLRSSPFPTPNMFALIGFGCLLLTQRKTHTHTCMHQAMHANMHANMHAHMHAHTHTHTHTHTQLSHFWKATLTCRVVASRSVSMTTRAFAADPRSITTGVPSSASITLPGFKSLLHNPGQSFQQVLEKLPAGTKPKDITQSTT